MVWRQNVVGGASKLFVIIVSTFILGTAIGNYSRNVTRDAHNLYIALSNLVVHVCHLVFNSVRFDDMKRTEKLTLF